ncbi:MAG: hypothetical protein ACI4RU_06815 [Acutalibacteraceae bacterium]
MKGKYLMSKKTKAPAEKVGVYVCLGPSIRGVIQNGSIFHGTMTEIKTKLSSAISEYPKIERFLTLDKDVPEIAEKLKGVNSLSRDFSELTNNL